MPNDPNSYFQSYERQMRSLAAQYAAGDPQSTRKDPFVLPKYYGKPRLGTSLKTSFNNGALPDPVNYQPSSTFHQLFHTPDDAARRMASHVVLEDPSGQTTKSQLGLPYKAHSVVDPEAAARFFEKLTDLKSLNLPHGEYAVTSSGAMAAHGLRDAADVDVITSHSLWNTLSEKYPVTTDGDLQKISIGTHTDILGPGSYFRKDSIVPLAEQISSAQMIRGVPFVSLENVSAFKVALARPKDLVDVAKIKAYHTVLESQSGQSMKRRMELPFDAHSTVNPIQAAYMMAKSELQKIFGKDVIDSTVKKTASFISTHAVGESLLKSADNFAGSINSAMEDAIRMSPSATRYARHAAARSEAFSEDGDFGKAWGALHSSLSSALGFDGHDNNGAGPGNMDASRFVLKNVVGPYLLLGLTIAPLAIEVGTKIRHALHKGTAQNIAEEHHNLETPTGRYLKDIMGLPYQSQSRVDILKALKFPTLIEKFTGKKTESRIVSKSIESHELPVPSRFTPAPIQNMPPADHWNPDTDFQKIHEYYETQQGRVDAGEISSLPDVHAGIKEALGRDYLFAWHGAPARALDLPGGIRERGLLRNPHNWTQEQIDARKVVKTKGQVALSNMSAVYLAPKRSIAVSYSHSTESVSHDVSDYRRAILVAKVSVDSLVRNDNRKFDALGNVINSHELVNGFRLLAPEDLLHMMKGGAHNGGYISSLDELASTHDIPASDLRIPDNREIVRETLGPLRTQYFDNKKSIKYAEKQLKLNEDLQSKAIQSPSDDVVTKRAFYGAIEAKENTLLIQSLQKKQTDILPQLVELRRDAYAKAIPPHVVLADKASKDMKARMGLPYEEDSIVDIFKALKFPTLLHREESKIERGLNEGALSLLHGEKVNYSAPASLPKYEANVSGFIRSSPVARPTRTDSVEEDVHAIDQYFRHHQDLVDTGKSKSLPDALQGMREALGRDTVNLYHGTPSRFHDAIKAEGIKLNDLHTKGVYLGFRYDVSLPYAQGLTQSMAGATDRPIMLRAKVEIKNLIHSENSGVHLLNPKEMIGISGKGWGELAHVGSIGSDQITLPTEKQILRAEQKAARKDSHLYRDNTRKASTALKDLYAGSEWMRTTDDVAYSSLGPEEREKGIQNYLADQLPPLQEKLRVAQEYRTQRVSKALVYRRKIHEEAIPPHVVLADKASKDMKARMGLPYEEDSIVDIFKALKFPTLAHESQLAVEHIAKPKYIQYRPKFNAIFVKTASEGAPVTLSLLESASGINMPSALSGSSIFDSYVRSKFASLMGNTEVALLHQEHIAALKEALKTKSSTVSYVQQSGSVSGMRRTLRHEGFHAMQHEQFGDLDRSYLSDLGHGSQFSQNPLYKRALKANLGLSPHYRTQRLLGISIGRVEIPTNLVSGLYHSLDLNPDEAYSLLKDYTRGQVKRHGPDKVISAFQNTTLFAKDALRDVLSETHPEHYQSYGTQYASDFKTGRISSIERQAHEERLKFSHLQYRTSVGMTRESRRNLTPERVEHAQELLKKHGVLDINAFGSKLDSLPESHPLYLEARSDYSTARQILQAPASITRLKQQRVGLREDIRKYQLLLDKVAAAKAIPQHVNLETPSGQAMKDRMGLPYKAHSVVDPIASANAAHLNPRQKRIRLADLTQQYKDLNTKVQNGFDIKEHLTPEALVAYTARETGGFQGDPYKPSYHVEVAKFDALEEDRKNLLQVLTDAREIFPASKSTDYMFEPSRRGPEREAFKKTLLENPTFGHAQFIIRGRKDPIAYSNWEGMQAIGGENSYGVSVSNTQHHAQKLRDREEIHGLSEDERVQKDLYGKFKASGGDANIMFLRRNSTASEIFGTRRHELHHRKQASLGEMDLRNNSLYRPAMEESPHFKSLSESLTQRGYPEGTHGAEATAHLAHGRFGRTLTSSSEVAALDITYRAANDVMSRKGVEAGKELFSASVPVPKGLVKALAGFSQEERDHIKGNIGRTGLGTMFMKFQHENPNETVEGSLGGHLSEGFHSYLKLNNLDGPTEQLKASMKVAGHVNLESPTGRFLKKVLSLPYHEFSTVNPIKAAREFFAKVAKAFTKRLASVEKEVHTPGGEEFPQVRKFVDDIETLYPNLIKKPRAVLRAFYDLQTSAYSYFAKHDNIFVSTLARTLLMAEKVEHVMDHTYKFSPGRQISKLFRSAVGAEKRNYAHLALDGIETGAEHIMQRRIVILGGIVIGLTETVFSYLHLYHKFSKIWHKYFRPEKDPEELHSERLERERRKGYRDARRNGEKYDPTLPGRQNRKEEKHENLLEEMLNQINPIAAAGRLAKAIRDPRKHIQSLSMYGAFAALVGVTVLQSKGVITKGLAHGLSSEAPGITSGATRDFYRFFTQGMHNLGPGMKAVTAFGGIVGFVFGRSASARAGSFSNVIATYIADTIGKRVAEKLVATDVGIEWAAKLYNQISLIPKYLDIENKFLKDKFKGAEVTSKQLFAASTARAENRALSASESEALKAAQRIAGQLGMEVGGVVLEGFLLAPLRNILRSVGKRIDQTSGLKRARNLGRGFDRQDKEKKNRTADGDDALRRYLSTFSAPAFSQSDLFTNTDYNTATRTTLLSLRRTEIGRTFLDSMSPFVTKIRRIKAGVRAVFTTKLGGRGKHEDWRIRLTRSYNTPAYSKMDIASNPQYSAAQRLLLLGISRTQNGETMLEDASPAVTRLRRIRAWLDGLRNPRELGAHAVTHAVRKGHHSIGKTMSSVSDKALGKNVSQASTDILHTFSGAVNDTGQAIKDARSSSKKRQGKVKIRSNSRIKDHALDEDMLHNAYSRYINYGHEGDALSYSDQTQ